MAFLSLNGVSRNTCMCLHRVPPLSRYGRGWRLGVAWAINFLTLTTTWLGVMLACASSSEERDDQQLQASATPYAEWWASVATGVALSCAESYVIIDGIKVCMFTLTSSITLERALPHGSRQRVLMRKPLRRLHKVIDAFL
jgi:hypothetical protein